MSETTLARQNRDNPQNARPATLQRLSSYWRTFWRTPGVRGLLGAGTALEAFLLALWVIIPAASVSLSVSPLARLWPWLLAPAHVILGDTLASTSLPPGNGLLALFALGAALVGASCAAVIAIRIAPRVRLSRRGMLALALGATAIFGLTSSGQLGLAIRNLA